MPEVPYGYCHCGCGQRTVIAPSTNRRSGDVKGQPRKFVKDHMAGRLTDAQVDQVVALYEAGLSGRRVAAELGVGAGSVFKVIQTKGISRREIPLEQRFWKKVRKTEGCWMWTGTGDRYGQVYVRPVGYRGAHRVAYELTVGPIPEGMVIDHLCRNTRCVNPAHLEVVTQAENVRRGYERRAA